MFFSHHFILESVFMTFWWTTFLNQMMKSINVSSYSLFSSFFTCHVIYFMIAHFWTNVCVFFFEFEHDYSSVLFFVKFNLFNVIHVLFSSFYTRECARDVLMINISDSNDEVDRCFFILVVLFVLYMSYYLRAASLTFFVELRIVELKSWMKNIKRENKTISFSRLIFLIRLLIRRLIIVFSTSKFDQSTKDTTINTIDTSVHLYMMSITNLSFSYKRVNQLNDFDQDWLQLLRRSSFLTDYMRDKRYENEKRSKHYKTTSIIISACEMKRRMSLTFD
jgi:hypothetical protein